MTLQNAHLCMSQRQHLLCLFLHSLDTFAHFANMTHKNICMKWRQCLEIVTPACACECAIWLCNIILMINTSQYVFSLWKHMLRNLSQSDSTSIIKLKSIILYHYFLSMMTMNNDMFHIHKKMLIYKYWPFESNQNELTFSWMILLSDSVYPGYCYPVAELESEKCPMCFVLCHWFFSPW